jgi:glutamate---cysteine ligase / carboxylate-amine ligase
MSQGFTLGIEEEFQMVDKQTGLLASHVHTILEKGSPIFGDHISAEMLQAFVELSTGVCPNIADLRLDLQQKIVALAQLLEEDGLMLIRAGTHPIEHWRHQQRTYNQRYEELEEEYQDIARSILIFGLHIHVGIENHEIAIPLMNQLRTWLPHLLALSTNSPFWLNRNTGIKSYRSIVWKRFPRSGIPPLFTSTAEYDQYVEKLVLNGCIDNAKKIWWDIRPHPFFGTIEFRIFDMPATSEDSIAIAALCQALVAKLSRLYQRNLQTCVLPTHIIEENKWKAARYGLDAEIVDFARNCRLSMRESLHELFDFVDDVLDDLDIRRELLYLRMLVDSPLGTGADRQLAIYHNAGNIQAVVEHLMQQSSIGVTQHTPL